MQDLCLSSYLSFLETECKAWIDLTSGGSRILQTAALGVIPCLQNHLSTYLSGTASSNLRDRMFGQITSGAFPSPRYRNCVVGEYQGHQVNFGLFESFHRVHEDVAKHSSRCARLCCTGVFIVEAMLKVRWREPAMVTDRPEQVVINDELRELVLPSSLVSDIWGRERGDFHEGGIEMLVPFHYPALLASYTESLLFSPQGGLSLRRPALTKLKVRGKQCQDHGSLSRLATLTRRWT